MKLLEYSALKFSGIYCITNLETGNKYIGQSKYISRRIREHIRSSELKKYSDYDYPLHKAFRKYGYDCFELEVLEVCDTDKLDEREKYWIDLIGCKDSDYNQIEGGRSTKQFWKLSVENINEIIHLLKTTSISKNDLARNFNVSRSMIDRINSGRAWRQSNQSYPIRPVDIANELNLKNFYQGTLIEQIDPKTNKVIARYSSRKAAGIAMGCSDEGISIGRCCSGKRQKTCGYKWRTVSASYDEWKELFLQEKEVN